VRCWNAPNSVGLTLALALACRTAPVGVSDLDLSSRGRLIRIEDTRRIEAAFLDSALRAPDASMRRAAALTAGRVGARAQTTALRALATDPDARVSSAALYALGLIRDTASVNVAVAGLRGTSDIASEAAWLLGEVGEAGRAALLAIAADSTLDSRRRGPAILALARLRPPPVAPLLPLLGAADTAIAWRAAYVVARARSAAAAGAMIAATASASPMVRDYAARGLARSLTGDSLAPRALDALRRLATDPDARVRVTAVRVLGAYGAPARSAIATALRDSDPAVRVTAAGVAHVALDSSASAWNDVWRSDTSFLVRRALAESGARRGMLRDAWQSWRGDAHWQRRAAAATFDGLGPASTALQRLDAGLRDADGRVRAAATEALAGLVDSAGVADAVRRRLRGALPDPDFVVRATALGALAKGASIEDLAAALRSHGVASRDADLDARLAFWTLADSTLRAHGSILPDSVARALSSIPRPTEPLERSRAASIARFAGWRDSTSEPREDAWYRARAREALAPSSPVARIETERGPIELVLFAAEAPVTVHNFVALAKRGYFDGQRFHRVVPNFVVQAGDPRGDGNGGPGYAIRDELNPHRYVRGTLGMALSGPNTGGSQFFVTHAPQPHLDGGYTVFGQLRSGGEVLDRILQGDRIVRITIH
jgi:cyclophilin family peptidyl-prolyl cis-trans isomerase/HEAT repeat protein